MTPFAVATFRDSLSAQTAVERLESEGFQRRDITLYENGAMAATNETAIELDEVVTGGFVGSFANLLHGLFQSKPEAQALTYADAVRTEGAMVVVNAASPIDIDRIVESLRAGGAIRVARLPQAGLES